MSAGIDVFQHVVLGFDKPAGAQKSSLAYFEGDGAILERIKKENGIDEGDVAPNTLFNAFGRFGFRVSASHAFLLAHGATRSEYVLSRATRACRSSTV